MDEEDRVDGPVEIPIDGTLDLHTFPPDELAEVLDAYLEACLSRGIFAVRVVHGKGRGWQKRRVEALLRRDPRVRSFRTADPAAGGWGATLVELEPPGPPK